MRQFWLHYMRKKIRSVECVHFDLRSNSKIDGNNTRKSSKKLTLSRATKTKFDQYISDEQSGGCTSCDVLAIIYITVL